MSVGQSKTPEPACARGRSDTVYETVPRTVTDGTDQWTIKELTSEQMLIPHFMIPQRCGVIIFIVGCVVVECWRYSAQ